MFVPTPAMVGLPTNLVPEATMFDRHAFADRVGALFFQKVEPRLAALLAEHGASHPGELPRAILGEIMRRAVVETAAANFPEANLEALGHGFQSFAHPAFFPALKRMRLSCKGERDAFDMTRGIYAAVVLAGFGLPVAPFDLVRARILGKPSNDIDTVLSLFSNDKTAFVGYSTCDAPFYLLLTDCVRTLRKLVPVHPRLSDVRKLFARTGGLLPSDPGQSFISGMAICGRQPGDTISTVGLLDPDPMAGSITLYAGWQMDGEPYGAPNDGYLPVPAQLLRAVVFNPEVAYSLSRRVGTPRPMH
jgi:hypothetical protein